MCGIFGYTGTEPAKDKLLNGLRLLEYRGYDSAGIAVFNGELKTLKSKGNIDNLSDKLDLHDVPGHTGIAHTRWATHGEASENNAHPHTSNSGRFVLVHNGIIDNYQELKQQLESEGYTFYSETDTEVLVNYLAFLVEKNNLNLNVAVETVLKELKGSFAFSFIDRTVKPAIWIARSGAPLVLGIKDKEFFVSSDIHALSGKCDQAVFLENRHFARISSGEDLQVWNDKGAKASPKFLAATDLEEGDYGSNDDSNYEHITMKEIHEQPDVIRRLLMDESHLEGLSSIDFSLVNRVILLGCGTSLHSAMLAKKYIEKQAGVPVVVEQASEFRYSDPLLFPTDLVVGISQSGETADTLQACYLAKDRGIQTLGVTNNKFSTITRELDACVYLKAGKEIGVASTKAFTAQILLFLQLAEYIRKVKHPDLPAFKSENLQLLPVYMEDLLSRKAEVHALAKTFAHKKHFLFIGRGISYPMAMEGALKLKELSYIHAEGYQSAELKHGPLALLDEDFPVLLVAPEPSGITKNIATANEIVSRSGDLIAMIPEGDHHMDQLSRNILTIPVVEDELSPLLASIPLQLFSFYVALENNRNVDQPRNLAKSVTVE